MIEKHELLVHEYIKIVVARFNLEHNLSLLNSWLKISGRNNMS
jgi:hypothetical protein